MITDAKLSRVQFSSAPAASPDAGGDFADSKPTAEAERLARYRLVIEQGSRKGAFIYKILDRETGEVVKQLPLEEVARLGESQSYAAGAVINTRA